MARPVGSKNKASKSGGKPVSKVGTSKVMVAFKTFEDKLTSAGEEVTTLLASLAEDLAELRGSVETMAPEDEPQSTNGAKPTKAAKAEKSAKAKKSEEPDFEDMDADELQAFIDDNNLEDDVDLDDYKGLPKKRKAVAAAYAATQGGEEEEGEGSTAGEAPDFEDMDADELQEFIDDNGLEDVDLDDYKGLPKKQKAVAKAYAATQGAGDDTDW